MTRYKAKANRQILVQLKKKKEKGRVNTYDKTFPVMLYVCCGF